MADTSLKVSPSQRERLLAMNARGADGSLNRSNLKCRKSRNFSWAAGSTRRDPTT
jgi:hypothetical protein